MSDKDSESPTQPNDDRNIAKVDSDTAGLTPDEQLTLIWDKYKSLVIKVAASLLIIGAFLGSRFVLLSIYFGVFR